tara:strand:- start:1349 stop:2197 length:849 start_codon:yes stop_codon:yes gene_type:complete
MNHPAELAVHRYLQEVVNGTSTMDEAVIDTVATDIKDALNRQFNGGKRGGFNYRMSNIGRPSCQLWWEKNHADKAIAKPTTFVMNMMIGDIVEAVFKALLTQAGIKFQNSEKVTLNLKDNKKVTGTYDLIVDGAVDDIKSASDWSYKFKFESIDTLKNGDSFGYVGQLAGYAVASDKKIGGWWVVNKANGHFKYVRADNIDLKEEIEKIERNIELANGKELVRCFEPEPETFRSKATGNMVINKNCNFCDYRRSCWETLQELPAQKSLAKEPKIVQYVSLAS